MSFSEPAPRAVRHARSSVRAAVVVVGAALVGILGYQSLTPSSFSAASPIDALLGDQHAAGGAADGVLPDGVTVFDDEQPAVTNLDPALLAALRQAATDAANDGVELYVNSGWRSAEYQEQLLDDAVSEYGSEEVAARWVATPETSPHVSGDAVDVGDSDAQAWLSERGPGYGLCQIYGNEPWHFELRPEAIERGCPPMYADPSRDPRMHQ
jgi:D-alanyl-D-alanine carboxypeptidase